MPCEHYKDTLIEVAPTASIREMLWPRMRRWPLCARISKSLRFLPRRIAQEQALFSSIDSAFRSPPTPTYLLPFCRAFALN